MIDVVPFRNFFDALTPYPLPVSVPVPASPLLPLPDNRYVQAFVNEWSCTWVDFVGDFGFFPRIPGEKWYQIRYYHSWMWYNIAPPFGKNIGFTQPTPPNCIPINQLYYQLNPAEYDTPRPPGWGGLYFRENDIAPFTTKVELLTGVPQPNPYDSRYSILYDGIADYVDYRVGFFRYTNFTLLEPVNPFIGGCGVLPMPLVIAGLLPLFALAASASQVKRKLWTA